MRIAVFSLAYRPFVGGAEVAVQEITRRLPDREFSIFTNRFDSSWVARERSGNSEIIRLGRGDSSGNYYGRTVEKFTYVFRAWRAAEQAHKSQPFKAIWAIMASYGGIAALLFKLSHPKVPMLLTLQEGDSESHILRRVGILRPLWKFIFKRADQAQAISHFLADFGRKYGASCPIAVVPNGVGLGKYQVSSIKYQEKSIKTIITTSRLVHKNGIDVLIRAAAELKHLIPNTKYFIQILGSGPDEQKLKILTSELGVSDKVDFLGHLEPEKIPEHLAQADIFVRASRSEGLGNSFLEAMAAGLPVIGTPVGGIPDFLKDQETGLFAKVNDPKDLADKIKLLLENRELRDKIAGNGQKLVLENYSWDRISEKMSAIFQFLDTKYLIPNTRLLIATGIYPPDIGGPATYTILLERELPKRGFTVGVLPFTSFRKKPKIIRHLAYFWRCLKMAGNFDFVYAQDPVSVGLPALIAARLRRKKFFIRVAGDYAWEQAYQRFGVKDGIDGFQIKKYGWRVELLRKIQKWVVGRADLVITPSKYFQKLIGGWVRYSEKIRVIYNGIDFKEYYQASPNNLIAEKTIVSVGRLVPWKGFDFLIKLMGSDLTDWKLDIIGDGPDMERLKKIARKETIGDQVRFIQGQGRKVLLNSFGAGIFILNTSFESFSFAVVEAMNAGVPVIATNIGSLPELVENGREGILVQPNDKAALLAAIKKIDGDIIFREMIIRNAKEKVQQFSISRTVDNLVHLINEFHA